MQLDTLNEKTQGGRITVVDYNVATDEDQATGVYTTTLVYTATTKIISHGRRRKIPLFGGDFSDDYAV